MTKTLNDLIQEARSRVREIDADTAAEMMDRQGVLMLDVREPYEFERSHIPAAVLVPRGTLEGAADPNNPHRIEALYTARGRTIIVVCETGARSAMAADTLQQMGFEDVYNLAGGLKLWEAEDLDLESGPYGGPLP
ncbi:MAG: rhodanese-like domain-containing protein [Chromatiales bacterium]|jgi:rhodanese-related sulfurtransferase